MARGAIAVLCHPHPLYGGSMHDRVLSTVAHRFIESGITCLRFNESVREGVHDNGEARKMTLFQLLTMLGPNFSLNQSGQ